MEIRKKNPESIYVRCTKEDKEYLERKSKDLKLTVSNLLINGAKSYTKNPMIFNSNDNRLLINDKEKLKQMCELNIYIDDLANELGEQYEKKFYEIIRKCEEICLL